jgi:hypothetical protein
VELVADGRVVATRTPADMPRELRVEFDGLPAAKWFALVVEDGAGRKAYTNPVWVAQ